MEHTGLLGLHVDRSLLDCPGSPLLPLNPGPFVTRLCSKQQLGSSHKPHPEDMCSPAYLDTGVLLSDSSSLALLKLTASPVAGRALQRAREHAVARSCMGPMLAWSNCHSRLFSFTVLCTGTALCSLPHSSTAEGVPGTFTGLCPLTLASTPQFVTVSFLSNNAHLGVKLLPADSRLLGDQAFHANSGEASLCRGARHALRCSAPVVPQAGRHGRHGCLQRKILGTVMQVVF